MREFIKAKKLNFLSEFKWFSLISSVAWTLYLIFRYTVQRYEMEITLILFGYLIALLLLPILLQVLGIPFELIKFYRITKHLNSAPIDGLKRLGFQKTYSENETVPILTGLIDKYPIRCEVENGVLRVIAETDLDLVEDAHWDKLKGILGKRRIENGLPGIALVFKGSKWKNLSSCEFESEIKNFVKLLWQENLTPWKEK